MKRFRNGLVGAVVGALPGIIIVLVATFVIEGEMQLSIGAPGIILAIAGAVAGAVFGLMRPPGQDTRIR